MRCPAEGESMTRLYHLAQRCVASVLQEGQTAVDTTVGNGCDTEFLARLVGPTGKVIGFDIDCAALLKARQRFEAKGIVDCVTLIHDTHAALCRYRQGIGVAHAVMFNLGYRPGHQAGPVTNAESSIAALEAALELLAPVGLITVVAYPGHPGGLEECRLLESWVSANSDSLATEWIAKVDPVRLRPGLLCVRKNARDGACKSPS
jgi:hypothetical protein